MEGTELMKLGVLDKLPAWLRHALIGLLASVLTAVVPVLTEHQGNIRDWIVNTLHLPLFLAPILGAVLTGLFLRFTTLTTQYGVGSTTPPVAPVVKDGQPGVVDPTATPVYPPIPPGQ